jgi:putative PIN family toxin of toxin-antitoxin system
MTRAVLDANVFVSAILTPHGAPARVLTAWRAERFHLVVSEAILDEIARVLRYERIARRHGWSDEQLQVFIEDVAHLAILTPGRLRLAVIADDPTDDRYLESAIEGDAEYIVSGDQRLLKVREFQGIRLLTPRAFLGVLRERAKTSR